jgi:hypothetical protein
MPDREVHNVAHAFSMLAFDTRSEPAASVRKELSTFIRGEPPNQW